MTARTVRIEPSHGWSALNIRDLWEYRDLVFILAMRDVKLRYKQTVLGVVWVILQPLITAAIFALIFGRLGNLPSGGLPYLPFAFAGMLPWNFFSQSLQRASSSLITDSRLISKVYFPRMIVPISSTLAVVMDFGVAVVVMLGLMIYYQIPFTWRMLVTPLLFLVTFFAADGISFWLSAFNVYYRDFTYAAPFLIQAWMYASPVAYSSTLIPEKWLPIYALNPMVGLIEGFRWALLGTGAFSFTVFAPTLLSTAFFLITGAFVFRRVERAFADVI